MKNLSYRTLYAAWAVMFVLTAALGFAFPEVSNVPARWALALTAAAFFLPPWLILNRAKAEGGRFHIVLIRWLCIGSLSLTTLLLCLNAGSAGAGEKLGTALHGALMVVSVPMGCSNFFALPIFLWGTLLTDTFMKK